MHPMLFRSSVVLLLLAAALSTAPPTEAGGVWSPVGPAPGAEVTVVDGLPVTDGGLLAITGGTLHLSQDGGGSWMEVLSGGVIDVVFSPADPQIAYAVTQHTAHRSADGGLTWEETADFGESFIVDLWADPDDPDVAYLQSFFRIQFGLDPYSLHRTEDGGQTWPGVYLTGQISFGDVAFGAGASGPLLSGLLSGSLLRSEDDGGTWAPIDVAGLEPDQALYEIEADPAVPGRFLGSVFSEGGLYETLDSGDSWHPYGSGLPGGAFVRLLFDPESPSTVYAASSGRGIFRSNDGGATWSPIGSGAPEDRPEGTLELALTGDPKRLFVASDRGVLAADPEVIAPCVAGETTLCLQDGRFEARVAWEDFQSGAGDGTPMPLTDDTGAFWFFRDTNLELAVKMLDGRTINGHWWVFFGSLSNVPFTLTVRDTETGLERYYPNPPHTFASRGDTRGFEATGEESTAPWTLPMLQAALAPLTGPAAFASGEPRAIPAPGSGPTTCAPSPTVHCLADGRFRVEVTWEDFQGGSGAGRTRPLTGDTGAFWFFRDTNLELFVKVLDGRPVNGHWWVFFGSLTNVPFTLTVTDTEAGGPPRVYENPPQTFASRGDTTAF